MLAGTGLPLGHFSSMETGQDRFSGSEEHDGLAREMREADGIFLLVVLLALLGGLVMAAIGALALMF